MFTENAPPELREKIESERAAAGDTEVIYRLAHDLEQTRSQLAKAIRALEMAVSRIHPN